MIATPLLIIATPLLIITIPPRCLVTIHYVKALSDPDDSRNVPKKDVV